MVTAMEMGLPRDLPSDWHESGTVAITHSDHPCLLQTEGYARQPVERMASDVIAWPVKVRRIRDVFVGGPLIGTYWPPRHRPRAADDGLCWHLLYSGLKRA
jgi:hypothetical protein